MKILIADDDEKIRSAFRTLLNKDNLNAVFAEDGEQAISVFEMEKPDIVFMDISMPKIDGLDVLKHIKSANSSLPVIIITGEGTMKTAVRAIQLGAFDYLTKPLDISQIRDLIKRANQKGQTEYVKKNENLNYKADITERYEIIGCSPQMQDVYKMIGSISTTPNYTSVLILGESGTGKELVARAIHNNGSSSDQPFVAINCTALPENLLESELFGHEKGSFTGAIERKIGKFEAAKNGTIFLDEIGSLSLNLQQKLLRVLQQRELVRVGGLETIPVNARFITATNSDLSANIKNGSFREDLFYRLNVAVVYLSPLRKRKDDVPILSGYFLSKYNFHLKKDIKGFSPNAMKLLCEYSYPGNVRELENIIERSVMLCRQEVIICDDLREIIRNDSYSLLDEEKQTDIFSMARAQSIHAFELNFLCRLLNKTRGNVSKAAKLSEMTRQNFIRLLKKHNIKSADFRGNNY